MSILKLVASFPMVASLRKARDLIDECRIHGLKIVPDDEHEAAAEQLTAGIRKNPEHAARMVIT